MEWATSLQFYYVIADPKIAEQNTLNEIVFKLQLIYSTVITWKYSYCPTMPWATCLQFYHVITNPKVDE